MANTKRSPKDQNLSSSEIEFLVGMAQDCFPPSAFDEEVQFYLDQLYAQETK
jgi:hypothetical protein